MTTSPLIILILTLGLVFMQTWWIITEPRPLKERFTKSIIISYFGEILIVLLQILSALFFPWPATPFDHIIVAFGILLYIAGLALAFWAKDIMKEVWGAPTEASFKRQNRLVIEGPFKFSRNPIYTGLFLAFIGFSIALRSWFIFLRIPLIFYFINSAKQEEQNLEKHFGKKYKTYKRAVPRFLFI